MGVRKIYSAYDRPAVDGIRDFGPSATKQEFKDECDLNTLMSRYRDVGLLPAGRTVQYGDFTGVDDYQQAQNIILAARDQFNSLPSAQRERFRNDPVEFLKFVSEKGNIAGMRELGMLSDEAVARLDKEAADKLKPPEKPLETIVIK